MSSPFQPSFKPDEYLVKPGIGRIAGLARKLNARGGASADRPAPLSGTEINRERIDQYLRQGNFFYSK